MAVDAVFADLYGHLEDLPPTVRDNVQVVHVLYSSALIRGTSVPPERRRNEQRCVDRANSGQVMIADIGEFFTHHLRTEFGLTASLPRFRVSLRLDDPELEPPTDTQMSACFDTQGIDTSLPIVAFGGRADPIKGFDLLIAAAELVDREFQVVALCVPYSPTDPRIVSIRSALAAATFSHSVFEWFSREMLRCLCGSPATKAVVVPSRGEPVGVIPQEAASWARTGSAVRVVSAVDGLAEQVTDGQDGFTFQPEDVYDLARKLTAALDLSDVARATMQENAYKRVRLERDYDTNFPMFVGDILGAVICDDAEAGQNATTHACSDNKCELDVRR